MAVKEKTLFDKVKYALKRTPLSKQRKILVLIKQMIENPDSKDLAEFNNYLKSIAQPLAIPLPL